MELILKKYIQYTALNISLTGFAAVHDCYKILVYITFSAPGKIGTTRLLISCINSHEIVQAASTKFLKTNT